MTRSNFLKLSKNMLKPDYFGLKLSFRLQNESSSLSQKEEVKTD